MSTSKPKPRTPSPVTFRLTLDISLTPDQWRGIQEIHALTGYATLEETAFLGFVHLARHYDRTLAGKAHAG